MGGWQTKYQVQDLADGQLLECLCKRCGHLHYLAEAALNGRGPKYIDEVQRSEGCRARVRRAAKFLSSPTRGDAGIIPSDD